MRLGILFSLLLMLLSSGVRASTICVYNCPVQVLPSDPVYTPVSEVYSLGQVDLTLDIGGIIFLDIGLYDTHPALTIDPLVPIYPTLDDARSVIDIPDHLQLFQDNLGLGGPAYINTDAAGVYVFLMDFGPDDTLDLSPSAIILVDGADLLAVPVPAAFWLFTSGVLGLASFSRRGVRR